MLIALESECIPVYRQFMQRLIILLMPLLLTNSLAGDLELRPLSEIVARVSESEDPDMSEFAYIGDRGGSLFVAISGILEATAGENVKMKKMGKTLEQRALILMDVSRFLNISVNKMSEEAIDARLTLLVEEYTNLMLANKTRNNEFFSPFILSEMDSVNEIFPIFNNFLEPTGDSGESQPD